ncbi:MAG: HAMP domain-containing sensor histidine kinase [Clostridia bacterium]|nr:HAMP domain-containing sensor histidine kinase [Clostridia bacterium]
MIKKLRKKLFIITTISLTAVFIVLLGVINLFSFFRVRQYADDVLDILIQSDGAFPTKPPEPFEGETEGEVGSGERFNDGFKGDLNKETPFETRFFTYKFNENGEAVFSDISQIALSESQALSYARIAYESGKDKGSIGEYRYATSQANGETLVIIMDCSKQLSTARWVLIYSCIMVFVGIIVVSLIVYFFSGYAIKPVEEAYNKQKRFITDSNHELRTPLAVISANTEVLELEQGENEWITNIKSQITRMDELTKNLTILSRIEEVSKDIERYSIDLSVIAEKTANENKQNALLAELDLKMNIAKDLRIVANENEIKQLINILLNNAVKYATAKTDVSFNVVKQNSKVLIQTVNSFDRPDNCPDNMECIFERFYRLDGARSAVVGGSGIGLSIAKAIVTANKGSITATANGNVISISAIFNAD